MAATISVIVPIYNCEAYLQRCLDSIRAQTFKDFEAILINDGSTDRSKEICKAYMQMDERFSLINQENQGQSAARNAGIQLTQGEWIHFVDADDAIHPQMLEILYSAVKKTGAGISMCGFIEGCDIPADFTNRIEQTERLEPCNATEDNLCDLLWRGDKKYWVVWGKLIRRDIVEHNLFEAGRIYEDNAVICKWLYDAGSIVDVQKELYFYFVNEKGTTKSSFSEKQLDRLWAIDEQASFYRSIRYERLSGIMEKRYILACASCYRIADTRSIKKQIKRLCYHKLINKRMCIHLNAKERIHIWESFHPVLMGAYWAVRAKVLSLLRR